jgi:uncharacterized integral membrane protein
MKAKFIIVLALLALFAIFVIQNNQTVDVWFLFWQITGSRAAVLILTFLIGAVTGWLVGHRRKRARP